MSKYMSGAQVTGRIKTLTKEDLAPSKIMPAEVQEYVVDTMKNEEKQKNDYKSFAL
jgi:hypothetical protein